MMPTGHGTKCIVTLMLLAGAHCSLARLAVSAPPEIAAKAADPDDPKLAGHFSGRVIDADGKPVNRARLFVAPLSDRLDGEMTAYGDIGDLVVRATTDAEGRFEFDAPDMTITDLDGLPTRRRCLVIAMADGYGPDWIEVRGRIRSSTIKRQVNGTDLVLQLAKDDVPVNGQFVDPGGQPLAGARVRLTRLMIPRWRDLDRHLEIEEKSYAAWGSVDYDRSLDWPKLLPKLITETQTNADGRFTLTGLGRDRIAQLEVAGPSVADTRLRVMTRDAPDIGVLRYLNGKPTEVLHGATFTRQLKAGLTVTGLVRDRDTHAPIPKMWISRHYNPLTYPPAAADAAVTDENGRFTLSGLNPELLNWEKSHRAVTAFPQPGVPYQMARGYVDRNSEVLIECVCGIAYRLKLIDEDGQTVEADVTYQHVNPNPHIADVLKPFSGGNWTIMNRAARRTNGTYEGFVLPGPGAVLVTTMPSTYRPARVDPKAYFAPDLTNWTKDDMGIYGTPDRLSISGGSDQNRFAAIVLVNPPLDSGPLELSTTLVKDRPRLVSLIDPDGKPVVGVQTQGMTARSYDYEPPLRASSFPLTGLHPDRFRLIKFVHQDRKLVGLLSARGDGDAPYVVRMEPWAMITGRLVNDDGDALSILQPEADYKGPPKLYADISGDTEREHRTYVESDISGQFRFDKLVPSQSYRVHAYREMGESIVVLENLVLNPGEFRELGDIRTELSYEPDYTRPTAEDLQATANIPDEAWGQPVDGLRLAIVLKSPPVDENDRLQYDIVAENVSDHDLRFAAADTYEMSYYKIRLVDSDGNEAPRQPGSLPDITTHPRIFRCWLKPGERMVISTCVTKLVRLDAAGQWIESSTPDPYNHFVWAKPGRYSVSAAVELGTGMAYDYDAGIGKTIRIAAKGEWTGKLKTGKAELTLSKDAAQ